MTRRMRGLALAGAAGALFLAAPAQAGSSARSGSEVVGTIETVDPARGEVTLAESGARLTVTRDTQIVKDGRLATFSEVHQGDDVRASLSQADAASVERLEVSGAGGPFAEQGG